jgi:glutaredoxin 3
MFEVIIYTQAHCRLSDRAKQLLQTKSLRFLEKEVTHDVLLKREMIERTGGRITTPQVFINGKHIGGCDELFSLDKKGFLDKKAS